MMDTEKSAHELFYKKVHHFRVCKQGFLGLVYLYLNSPFETFQKNAYLKPAPSQIVLR